MAVLTTLFTQEMLHRGFLATCTCIMSWAHREKHIDAYLQAADQVFALIAKWMGAPAGLAGKQQLTPAQLDALAAQLKGPVRHGGFKRLVS